MAAGRAIHDAAAHQAGAKVDHQGRGAATLIEERVQFDQVDLETTELFGQFPRPPGEFPNMNHFVCTISPIDDLAIGNGAGAAAVNVPCPVRRRSRASERASRGASP